MHKEVERVAFKEQTSRTNSKLELEFQLAELVFDFDNNEMKISTLRRSMERRMREGEGEGRRQERRSETTAPARFSYAGFFDKPTGIQLDLGTSKATK